MLFRSERYKDIQMLWQRKDELKILEIDEETDGSLAVYGLDSREKFFENIKYIIAKQSYSLAWQIIITQIYILFFSHIFLLAACRFIRYCHLQTTVINEWF